MSPKSRHTIIPGDFNLNFYSDSSNDVKRMKELIKPCSMEQLISNSTGHILDWVMVEKDYKTVENVVVLDHLLSDHYSIIIDLDEKKRSFLLITA